MKKYLLIFQLLLLPTLTACQQSDEPKAPDKVKVTFNALLPDYIESRYIGDEVEASELYFWVFDENGQEYTELRQRNVDFSGDVAHVTTYLTPGHTYKFAFWAQTKGKNAYEPNNADEVAVNYEGALCNDRQRDAYYAWIPNLTVAVEGEVTRDIVLTRPLALVSFGIDDIVAEQLEAQGIDIEQSRIVIDPAYMAFNLMEQAEKARPIPDEVNFNWAAIPAGEKFKYGNDEYNYLGFSYFLPKAEGDLHTVSLYLKDKDGNVLGPYTAQNVNFKRNKHVKIVLRSMLGQVSFTVYIDEDFTLPDNNVGL